jgi:peptidoglycan lytic transglycosylase
LVRGHLNQVLAALLLALGATPAPASEASFGIASYYSGIPGPAGEFTAAHRSLPLGTCVRVTRLPSGRSVIVRINDRGPFVAGRIIDVSRRAADWLEMIEAGVVRVRVDVIPPGGAELN